MKEIKIFIFYFILINNANLCVKVIRFALNQKIKLLES